jgi:DNA-binding MarR family transcriptional regulator
MGSAQQTPEEQMRVIMETGHRLHDHIMKAQERHMREKVWEDLSMLQAHAVHWVHEAGELSMTELAERLDVSPPSASALVDRLVRKGYLARRHSEEDRRKVIVEVAPRALPGIEQFHAVMHRAFFDLSRRIGPETMRQWHEVMLKIRAILDETEGV